MLFEAAGWGALGVIFFGRWVALPFMKGLLPPPVIEVSSEEDMLVLESEKGNVSMDHSVRVGLRP